MSIITEIIITHIGLECKECVSLSVMGRRDAVTKTGVSDLGLKWVRLAQNGTNSGLKIRFQSECTNFKKVPNFPFGANLTHFWPKI